MRPAPWHHLERFRFPDHRYGGPPGEPWGAFQVPHPPTGVSLRIIASSDVWEHVSVSLPRRTPNWAEMEFACRLFWSEDEAVMQLHPPRSMWVNNHPTCLHLWRPPPNQTIPLPPMLLVGIPGIELDPSKPGDRAKANAMINALAADMGDL